MDSLAMNAGESMPLVRKDVSRPKVPTSRRRCRFWENPFAIVAFAWVLILVTAVILQHPTEGTPALSASVRAPSKSPPAAPSTPKSKYSRVQGLGFQIYTGGSPAFLETDEGSKELNPECIGSTRYGQMIGDEEEGKPAMLQCYLGLEDSSGDVQRRLRIMEEAVETAFAQADPDRAVLKVFLAPEFYWRGVNGAYEFEDEKPGDSTICGPVCQVLHGLETLVAQERFQDWVFLFGTVTAWENFNATKKSATMRSKQLPQGSADVLFYNFAPMYKGYDPARITGHGPRFIVPKRYLSSSDFLTPERHLHPSETKELMELGKHNQARISEDQRPKTGGTRNAVLNPHDFAITRYNNHMWHEYRQELDGLGYTIVEYDWLVLDGVTFSVEICLDHQMRSALTAYLGDMANGRRLRIPNVTSTGATGTLTIEYVPIPITLADISLVASAGMMFAPDAFVLTEGGTGFLQDGLSNETNSMTHSQDDNACDVSGWEFHGGTEAVQRRAFLSPTDIVWEHSSLGSFAKFPLYNKEDREGGWEDFLNGVFSTKMYRPHVVVFDPVDLPDTST